MSLLQAEKLEMHWEEMVEKDGAQSKGSAYRNTAYRNTGLGPESMSSSRAGARKEGCTAVDAETRESCGKREKAEVANEAQLEGMCSLNTTKQNAEANRLMSLGENSAQASRARRRGTSWDRADASGNVSLDGTVPSEEADLVSPVSISTSPLPPWAFASSSSSSHSPSSSSLNAPGMPATVVAPFPRSKSSSGGDPRNRRTLSSPAAGVAMAYLMQAPAVSNSGIGSSSQLIPIGRRMATSRPHERGLNRGGIMRTSSLSQAELMRQQDPAEAAAAAAAAPADVSRDGLQEVKVVGDSEAAAKGGGQMVRKGGLQRTGSRKLLLRKISQGPGNMAKPQVSGGVPGGLQRSMRTMSLSSSLQEIEGFSMDEKWSTRFPTNEQGAPCLSASTSFSTYNPLAHGATGIRQNIEELDKARSRLLEAAQDVYATQNRLVATQVIFEPKTKSKVVTSLKNWLSRPIKEENSHE